MSAPKGTEDNFTRSREAGKAPDIDHNYRSIPALAAYIDRVGAEQLNFRTFLVKEYKGHYYIEKAYIRILDDGSIKCKSKEHEPTEDERQEIKVAVRPIIPTWPHSINATPASVYDLREKLRGNGGQLFVFYDRKPECGNGTVIMVQERLDPPDGKKRYMPHSFWSDGQWRCMEPHRKLPFWKPQERRTAVSKIMIHEGPKVASHLDWLVNDPEAREQLEKHPWKEDLIQYEHWGMIGGALAPDRTEYAELYAEEKARGRPIRAVYCCDNDWNGKNILKRISENYGRTLKGFMPDDDWGEAWDMFDPIPATEFDSETGHFKGKRLHALLKPATWATEQWQGERGRPYAVLKTTFAQEWCHCPDPEVFVHRDFPSRILTAKAFNNDVRPYSHVKETDQLLMTDDVGKVLAITYEPGAPSGHHGNAFNVHVPSDIRPVPGDAGLWEDYIAYLVPPAADREEMIRWVATLVCLPKVKMRYALLLISETQGIGKDTLGNILRQLLGGHNIQEPDEKEIVDQTWTYWCSNTRLIIVHEIYDHNSVAMYNALKSKITDTKIRVMLKYIAPYDIPNWLHVYACSNHMQAIKLTGTDRRWLVPEVTEQKRPREYWRKFYDWLDNRNGYAVIRWWLEEWLRTHEPVNTADDAPWTIRKKAVVAAGYSPGQTLVADTLNAMLVPADDKAAWIKTMTHYGATWDADNEQMNILIADLHLRDLIQNELYGGQHNDKLERPRTIRVVAKDQGWFINKAEHVQVSAWTTDRTWRPRLICSSAADAAKTPGALAEEGRRLFKVLDWYRDHARF